nr:MAG TPA: hypothetical protein [Caudoviricetes sp.]
MGMGKYRCRISCMMDRNNAKKYLLIRKYQ